MGGEAPKTAAAETDAKMAEDKKEGKKDDKKPKKAESAGISKAERDELKIKEDPTSAEGDKKKDEKKEKKKPASEEKMALEKRIEEYRLQLKSEFGYSDKDIKADPDYADMQKQLSKLK